MGGCLCLEYHEKKTESLQEDHLSRCTCTPAAIIRDGAALNTPASVTTRVTKAEQLVLIVPQKGGHMLTVEMDTRRLTGSTNNPVN